jgi:hypothetical protein
MRIEIEQEYLFDKNSLKIGISAIANAPKSLTKSQKLFIVNQLKDCINNSLENKDSWGKNSIYEKHSDEAIGIVVLGTLPKYVLKYFDIYSSEDHRG